MRKTFGMLAVAALLLVGVAASAAPVQTTATLHMDMGAYGSFSLTGAGTVSVVGSGNLSAVTTGGGTVQGSQILVPDGFVQITSTLVVPVQGTLVQSVILNPGFGIAGNGTFTSGFAPVAGEVCPQASACVVGGGVGGIMPLGGVVTAVLIPDINSPIPFDLLPVGVGGSGGAGIIAVEAAPWTTGEGQITTLNATLTVSGDPGEPISFVTPTYISFLGTELPAITTTFSLSGISVPEPHTLLLLGAGGAGLAWGVRRRA